MHSSNKIKVRAQPVRTSTFGTIDQKPRVVKVDLTTNKSHPPAAILVNYVDPSLSDLNSMKTSMYVPITTNDNNKCVPRLVMGVKPVPVFGQRHRPVVPITPRQNLALNSVVDFGKQFSSTTIVSGASQGEATILHGPLTNYERYIKANSNLEDSRVQNANVIVQRNEIVLEECAESSNAHLSEEREIQTIHMVGDFPNLRKDTVNPEIKETFISTKFSPGTCFVSMHKPNIKSTVKTNTTRPWKIVGSGRSRMIADNQTSIPVSEFKAQLTDTSDIVISMDIAPPMKKVIRLQHKGNNRVCWAGKSETVDLFESPGRQLCSKLLKLFTRHLKKRQILLEETFSDMELLPLGHTPKIDLSKVKRITRKRFYPEAEEYRRKLSLAKESPPLRFEHFVNENECIQTEFLHEEEILPDSYDTDPIFVEDSFNSLKKEGSQEMMCFYEDNTAIESDCVLEENQHPIPDGSTIIMLQKDQSDITFKSKNIEVLLAAAEKQGIDRTNIQKVIFRQSGNKDCG